MTTYRWLTSDEIADWVNPECSRQGWVLFNVNEERPTCRVMGAFEDTELVGFEGMSLFPLIGHHWVTQGKRNGVISREMAERMHDFMVEVKARGALLIADSPASEKLAERYGFRRVESPVYIWKPE